MSEDAHDETANGNGGDENGRQNIRSAIAFPYSSISDAEQVAEALHRRGDTATMDEIAAVMQQTTTSGAFRTKIATARTFGVIDVKRGEVKLTPLGQRLIDPEQADKARVDAFLHVPLYSKVYEEYRGRNLPPAKGLEATMERFGVSPKQTDRARQALQRSARRAGFFQSGEDRLVPPALSGVGGQNENIIEKPKYTDDAELPEWATKMWLTLLTDGETWSAEQIKAYVDGARTAYNAQG